MSFQLSLLIALVGCGGQSPLPTVPAPRVEQTTETKVASFRPEISCTVDGQTVKQSCPTDGYCSSEGGVPAVTCCEGSACAPAAPAPAPTAGCETCSISCDGLDKDGNKWKTSCSAKGCKGCIAATCSENDCVVGCKAACE